MAAAGETVKPTMACNIAFTADGLAALGLPPARALHVLRRIPRGDAPAHRSKILGDTEESDPANWEFGGATRSPIHAIVIVHAISTAALERACEAQRALLAETAGGVAELAGTMQSGYRPDGDHEPFGFHDGVAQPSIAGTSGEGSPTGEFILGYQNHYSVVPPTPVVPAEIDAEGSCPPSTIHIMLTRDCAISASTVPTSSIGSFNRTSLGSGSS